MKLAENQSVVVLAFWKLITHALAGCVASWHLTTSIIAEGYHQVIVLMFTSNHINSVASFGGELNLCFPVAHIR